MCLPASIPPSSQTRGPHKVAGMAWHVCTHVCTDTSDRVYPHPHPPRTELTGTTNHRHVVHRLPLPMQNHQKPHHHSSHSHPTTSSAPGTHSTRIPNPTLQPAQPGRQAKSHPRRSPTHPVPIPCPSSLPSLPLPLFPPPAQPHQQRGNRDWQRGVHVRRVKRGGLGRRSGVEWICG